MSTRGGPAGCLGTAGSPSVHLASQDLCLGEHCPGRPFLPAGGDTTPNPVRLRGAMLPDALPGASRGAGSSVLATASAGLGGAPGARPGPDRPSSSPLDPRRCPAVPVTSRLAASLSYVVAGSLPGMMGGWGEPSCYPWGPRRVSSLGNPWRFFCPPSGMHFSQPPLSPCPFAAPSEGKAETGPFPFPSFFFFLFLPYFATAPNPLLSPSSRGV